MLHSRLCQKHSRTLLFTKIDPILGKKVVSFTASQKISSAKGAKLQSRLCPAANCLNQSQGSQVLLLTVAVFLGKPLVEAFILHINLAPRPGHLVAIA